MKKYLVLSTLTFALAACTTLTPREQWQTLGDTAISAPPLADHQALAVFYRPAESHPKAVNLYINGDYQASLLAGSFTTMPVCGTKQQFSASVSRHTAFGNRHTGAHYTLPVQETAYLRVTTNSQGEAILAHVDQATASAEIAALKQVNTTVSRVKAPRDCQPVIAAKVLSLNALYQFDKAAYADLLPNGKQEIQAFVDQLKQRPANQISHIVVSGYTDPQGSLAYNQTLSKQRAQSVAQFLRDTGISAPIQAEGYGQRDLLIPDCAARYAHNKAQQVTCNQPNRRVEIAVYGH